MDQSAIFFNGERFNAENYIGVLVSWFPDSISLSLSEVLVFARFSQFGTLDKFNFQFFECGEWARFVREVYDISLLRFILHVYLYMNIEVSSFFFFFLSRKISIWIHVDWKILLKEMMFIPYGIDCSVWIRKCIVYQTIYARHLKTHSRSIKPALNNASYSRHSNPHGNQH